MYKNIAGEGLSATTRLGLSDGARREAGMAQEDEGGPSASHKKGGDVL